MWLKKWNDLPGFMKNDDVRIYHDILSKRKVNLILKRLFDFIVSLAMIIMVSPIMIILAILIMLDSNGPILYKQERITQYGRKFKILKFRTMVLDADKIGSLITKENDNRITRIGIKIRKCRLDELPQLFNVLVGDMSFVGTRPEVSKYVDCYCDEMYSTFLLPAGITSLTSLSFRDEDKILSDKKYRKMKLDDIYVEKILPIKMKMNYAYLKEFNVLIDFKIIIMTVIQMFR